MGQEICIDDLPKVQGANMSTWDHNLFLQQCIFSGCDYLDSIKGIGFKTAFKLFKEHRHYKKVIQQVRISGKYKIPEGYEEEYEKALLTFKF